MSSEAPERECRALRRLLSAAEGLKADFAADFDAALGPIVAEVLPDSGILLTEVVESFGWDGQRFTLPVSCQAFICRLKALMYDGLELKGRGAFATVYKARNRVSGRAVTLKKLRLHHTEEGVPQQAVREVSTLAELDHPHIVRLLDVLWDESRLYMILEYLDVDLRQHLDTGLHTSHPNNVKLYMYQILQGLEYAHARGVLHRDLKPQNILVDRTLNLCKLADFGLARTFVPPIRPYTHEVVTLMYRPPELLLGLDLYSTPIDIWSAGCIFAELVTGNVLFTGDSEVALMFSIFQKLGTPSNATWQGVSALPDWQAQFPQWAPHDLEEFCPGLDPLGLDLLQQMLAYDPNQRITARNAVEHPYFRGLRPYFCPGTPGADQSCSFNQSFGDSPVLNRDLQMAEPPDHHPAAMQEDPGPLDKVLGDLEPFGKPRVGSRQHCLGGPGVAPLQPLRLASHFDYVSRTIEGILYWVALRSASKPKHSHIISCLDQPLDEGLRKAFAQLQSSS